ncbi:unnamed protein product [Zymoseptoria tritici ST99CH_3D7]|uniref:non-specific serine/threonine protein kinase n=3 Tax=Zymoseptoria tritici TaxID=1047171 RepID=A0A1X7RDL1_ZYMT9|nr:unnamed protein product [Zymoseptoria tritici ST99CH_3D7]
MRNAHTDARFNVNFARQPEPQAMPRRRQSFGGEGTGFGRRHQSEFTPRQAPAQSFRDPGAFNTPRGFSRSEGPRRNTTRGQGIMSKYSKVKSLAHGGMSTAVNVVQDRSTGKVFVQKCIRVRQPKQMKRFRAELNTLQRIQKYGGSINLNNLIEFEASSRSPEAILILEYCDRGSLEDMMNSAATMGRPLPEAQAWNILLGVGMALGFLHKGVSRQGQIPNWDMTFHLDLRPCNIFLSSRGGQYGFPRVVLADFGCAVKASEVIRGKEDSFFQPCGSSFWYPPEGLGQTLIPHYGVKTDVWMLGATVHTFCGLLKIPNRLVLNSAVPCGLLYSASLNRSVAHLSHRVSAYRPAPEAIVATASVEFRRAVMRG